MLAVLIRHTLPIVVALFLAHRLAQARGAGEALVVWVVAVAFACMVGAGLLRSAPVGQIGWRNRVAGHLLPCGYLDGGGRLSAIVLASWLMWSFFGATTILLTGLDGQADPDTPLPGMATSFLVIALNVNVLVVFFCLSAFLRHYRDRTGIRGPMSTETRIVWKVLVLLVLVSGAGVWLYAHDRPWLGACLAAGPLVLFFSMMGLYLAVITTLGRNSRWN